MRRALPLLLVASCGRFGFDRRSATLFTVGDGGDPIFYGWHGSLLGTDRADGIE